MISDERLRERLEAAESSARIAKKQRNSGAIQVYEENAAIYRELLALKEADRWVPVGERSPEKSFAHNWLVWIKCDNKQGGYRDLAAYGDYICEMEDSDESDPRYIRDNDDGNWKGSGWHREEETHGGPYDTIFVDLNDKVTHWRPLPNPPTPPAPAPPED